MDANSALAVWFGILSVWAIIQRLNNKKSSVMFLNMLAISSVTLCAITFENNYITNKEIAHISNNVAVAFSPKRGTANSVVNTINTSKKSILVAAYSFSSMSITEALINAYQRGVNVQIVLDKSQKSAKYSTYNELKNYGVPVRINSKYAIMHNKFMIIDNNIVQTGSFNYTQAADLRNAENSLTIFGNKFLVSKYTQEWNKLWNEAA